MKTKLLSTILPLTGLALILGASLLTTSCEKKTVGDKIKDGLDARPNEKIKDAGEDVKDAAKDAKDAVKDAVK